MKYKRHWAITQRPSKRIRQCQLDVLHAMMHPNTPPCSHTIDGVQELLTALDLSTTYQRHTVANALLNLSRIGLIDQLFDGRNQAHYRYSRNAYPT